MPQTTIHFYREADGNVPFTEWLEQLAHRNVKAYKKCIAYLQRLRAEGHQLNRPIAAILRDGIYELRPSYQGVNYRILYGFAGKDLVVVSHGITKERVVPRWKSTGQPLDLPSTSATRKTRISGGCN